MRRARAQRAPAAPRAAARARRAASADLVAHAAAHAGRVRGAREYVEDAAARLDGRLAGVEAALRGTIAHRALVRYDAYNELSGQQSMSIALLDDERSGIVLSCIHHRDQARVYGKQVHGGRGELELSPEEAEAVRLARSRSGADGGAGGRRRAARLRARAGRPRVGYLGPEGTFSEEALLASAARGRGRAGGACERSTTR